MQQKLSPELSLREGLQIIVDRLEMVLRTRENVIDDVRRKVLDRLAEGSPDLRQDIKGVFAQSLQASMTGQVRDILRQELAKGEPEVEAIKARLSDLSIWAEDRDLRFLHLVLSTIERLRGTQEEDEPGLRQ